MAWSFERGYMTLITLLWHNVAEKRDLQMHQTLDDVHWKVENIRCEIGFIKT
jgi:hypothetical protein